MLDTLLILGCKVLFDEVLNGLTYDLIELSFTSSWWQHSENLASYEQQDAHEFFISVLDGIHERESKARNQTRGN